MNAVVVLKEYSVCVCDLIAEQSMPLKAELL